jgi:predicted O-linked N-acetylglucosamine transferase (SPINDLY family)
MVQPMTQVTVEQALAIAIEHHMAGRLAEAEGIYRQILAQCPDCPDALHSLGVLAGQVGQLAVAIDLIGRAIAVSPAVADYHSNLGECYRRTGRWDGAIACFHRALALSPNNAEIYNSLGIALYATGQLDEAVLAYGRAVQLRPDHAAAHNNLGGALNDRGRRSQAIATLRRAIALQPDLADPYNNLGVALHATGRPDEALAAYRRAVELRPDQAVFQNNLGNVLRDHGRLDEAVAAYERSIELQPDLADPYSNLGIALKEQGRLDEALESFREAVARNPRFSTAASNFVSTLYYHPSYDAQAIVAVHREWDTQFAAPLTARVITHVNDRTPDRTLRIGFVSPDLRAHPVGRSLRCLFAHHDRRRTTFIAYCDVPAADPVTDELRALADSWHSIVGLNDQQVAERIRSDQIDILVDTTLHTAGNRLLVFARKPAPIQLTMLGGPTTTGLTAMDYRLTDALLDPPGTIDRDYTEQSIRLPHCYWCYQPPAAAPAVGELPATRNGFVTFGCLNRFDKVSRPALEVWIKILQALPGARLVIQSQPGRHVDALHAWLEPQGIARERVAVVRRVSEAEYLARYGDLDLSLDPFPYNGHTCTLDALWMGVPVVTLAGSTAVGRGGVSILSNVGLPELIASTPEQYVQLAVALASDLERLAGLRAGLRKLMQSSVVLNGAGFTADVEAVFRRIWQAWCGRAGSQ